MRVPLQDLGQATQFVGGIGRARRVGRRVQDQPLGLRRDRPVQILGPQLEALLDRAGHEDRRAAGELHDVGIADPIRRGDHNLVARIEGGQEGIEDALLAAGGDGNLVGGIGQPVLPLELVDDGRLQGRRAVDIRIAGVARVDRRLGGFADRFRGVEIGLPRAEADDILARRFQLAGLLGHCQGGGGLDTADGGGIETHEGSPENAGGSYALAAGGAISKPPIAGEARSVRFLRRRHGSGSSRRSALPANPALA